MYGMRIFHEAVISSISDTFLKLDERLLDFKKDSEDPESVVVSDDYVPGMKNTREVVRFVTYKK